MDEPAQQPRIAGTAQRILEVAERLAQTRGFNGFSYADIATELGITKASLHYHFASKAELGCALIVGYRSRFAGALAEIGAADPQDTLRRYVQLYENVLVRDRMCLCGMLAAEISTLPQAMRAELRNFFDRNEAWLANHLESERRSGRLSFDGPALEFARLLTAGLEGAMLLARSYEEPARFAPTAERLLAEIGVLPQRADGAGRSKPRGTRAPARKRAAAAASR